MAGTCSKVPSPAVRRLPPAPAPHFKAGDRTGTSAGSPAPAGAPPLPSALGAGAGTRRSGLRAGELGSAPPKAPRPTPGAQPSPSNGAAVLSVYTSGNRDPSVVAFSLQHPRSVQTPPAARRGCEGCGGPRGPAGGASPPGGLGAVLPRFPEPSPAGATPSGTRGGPRRARSVPGKKKKKEQAQRRPRSSDAATNRGGVSPGGADVAAGKAALPAGRPRGTPTPGCPPGGRAGTGGEGTEGEAGGCAKSQRLLLSGCSGGGRPREPAVPAQAVRAGPRNGHSARGRFLGRASLRAPGCRAGPRGLARGKGPPAAPWGTERAPARRCPRGEPPRPGSPSTPLAQPCWGALPAEAAPAGHPFGLTYRVSFGFTLTPSPPGWESRGQCLWDGPGRSCEAVSASGCLPSSPLYSRLFFPPGLPPAEGRWYPAFQAGPTRGGELRSESPQTQWDPSVSPTPSLSLPIHASRRWEMPLSICFRPGILPHPSGRTVIGWERAAGRGRVLWTGRDGEPGRSPGTPGAGVGGRRERPSLRREPIEAAAKSGGLGASLPRAEPPWFCAPAAGPSMRTAGGGPSGCPEHPPAGRWLLGPRPRSWRAGAMRQGGVYAPLARGQRLGRGRRCMGPTLALEPFLRELFLPTTITAKGTPFPRATRDVPSRCPVPGREGRGGTPRPPDPAPRRLLPGRGVSALSSAPAGPGGPGPRAGAALLPAAAQRRVAPPVVQSCRGPGPRERSRGSRGTGRAAGLSRATLGVRPTRALCEAPEALCSSLQ
ncbi:collagen alpha-1(I) chain-like [Phalacrocorax carbo]|uniref:collagen alpha-1(I) chain-like n=1 Tax=Phalacrocorax carbo TaxID=9209 RepID=UPI00311A3CD2